MKIGMKTSFTPAYEIFYKPEDITVYFDDGDMMNMDYILNFVAKLIKGCGRCGDGYKCIRCTLAHDTIRGGTR